jgi:hypothetical protein
MKARIIIKNGTNKPSPSRVRYLKKISEKSLKYELKKRCTEAFEKKIIIRSEMSAVIR